MIGREEMQNIPGACCINHAGTKFCSFHYDDAEWKVLCAWSDSQERGEIAMSEESDAADDAKNDVQTTVCLSLQRLVRAGFL